MAMNHALQLISIQYELVLALTNDDKLYPVLHNFLRICNARLNLTSSHIFLYHNDEDMPCRKNFEGNTQLKHFCSLPQRHNSQLWSENNQLNIIASNFAESLLDYQVIETEETQLQIFEIPNKGLIIFEQHIENCISLKKIFKPVISKIRMTCGLSIRHDSLKNEIAARRAMEEQMQFQNSHDELTGLLNRREITRQLKEYIKELEGDKHWGALLFIDLSDFRSINNILGHSTGDNVLRDISNHLHKSIPSTHGIARFGGDRFVVLFRNLIPEYATVTVQTYIRAIMSKFEQPFNLKGNNYNIKCAAGYDIFSSNSKTASEIISHADLALYEAKRLHAEEGLAYNTAMSEELDKRISYSVRLKHAIENGEFSLHYQPQFNEYNEVIGAEALLRWFSPFNEHVSPSIYIPIAEKSDLIIHISRWVLNQACKDIQKLERKGLSDNFKISINVSARHLATPDFVSDILSAVVKHRINPKHLAIEITEGIVINDINQSISVLSSLQSHGIECSIDDFGTGYSSLAYLKQLPANLIKIDRSFVQNMNSDSDNRSIVEMIIGLGKNLKMATIAEGVETLEEVQCLMEMGCHQFQGYYFSKPLPYRDFTKLIEKNGTLEPACQLTGKPS